MEVIDSGRTAPLITVPETKPNYQTSEFWLTIGTNVAAILMTVQGLLPPEYAAIALVVANALYALSRGWAKSGVSPVAQVAPPPLITGPVEAAVFVEPSKPPRP